MKIHIEIVTGFLGSGKTSFINSLISESYVEGEKIIVLQLEDGVKKIVNHNNLLRIDYVKEVENLKQELLYYIKQFSPNRIIIEYNGTCNLEELLKILNEEIYRKCSKITTVFFIADGKRIKQYIENIGNFMIPCIQCANMIVVNNMDKCNKDIIEEGFKAIKKVNSKAYILKVDNNNNLNSILKESKVIENGYIKKLKIKIGNLIRE